MKFYTEEDKRKLKESKKEFNKDVGELLNVFGIKTKTIKEQERLEREKKEKERLEEQEKINKLKQEKKELKKLNKELEKMQENDPSNEIIYSRKETIQNNIYSYRRSKVKKGLKENRFIIIYFLASIYLALFIGIIVSNQYAPIIVPIILSLVAFILIPALGFLILLIYLKYLGMSFSDYEQYLSRKIENDKRKLASKITDKFIFIAFLVGLVIFVIIMLIIIAIGSNQ